MIHRMAVGSWVGFWYVAVVCLGAGCAAETDDGGLDEVDMSQPYSEAVSAAEELGFLPGGARVDVEEMLGIEKIRRGTVASAKQTVANATVGITPIDQFGNSLGGICTAQVINRYFLLTASHCLSMWSSGSGFAVVYYRDGSGNRVLPYVGPVSVTAEANPALRTNDTGLMLLSTGMNTCHGTISECSTAVPWNAVFQFFVPGQKKFLKSVYTIAGYGIDDDGSDNPDGILRIGGMKFLSADYANFNTGFTTKVTYTMDSQARACHGDSGGPLIVTGGIRLLHNGIMSDGDPTTCNSTQGTDFYSGLSLTQANFVFNQVTSFASSLGFSCASAGDTASGLFQFHCANDTSLYGAP